jgi:hypothetical protein
MWEVQCGVIKGGYGGPNIALADDIVDKHHTIISTECVIFKQHHSTPGTVDSCVA